MSISAAILDIVRKAPTPLTIAQVNTAMGGQRDYAANVYNLIQTGKLQRVGITSPLQVGQVAKRAENAPPHFATASLTPSLGTRADAPQSNEPARPHPGPPARNPPPRPDPKKALAPVASNAAGQPTIVLTLPISTTLRLIAAALSQPSQLTDADRALVFDVIRTVSEHTP